MVVGPVGGDDRFQLMSQDPRPPDRPASERGPSLPPVPTDSRRPMLDEVSPELLASLLADGDDELAAWALSQALGEAPRASVYDGLLADAMRLVGERWQSGRWTVAEEHLASMTLLRALDRIRPEQGPAARVGPQAVLAGVQGEHHMIGLVCLDHILREEGWTVANLGADVPSPDLARFIERNDVALLALTASDPSRTAAVVRTIADARGAAARRLGRGGRALPVLLGGRLAGEPGAGSDIGASWTVASLAEARTIAHDMLHGTSTPGA